MSMRIQNEKEIKKVNVDNNFKKNRTEKDNLFNKTINTGKKTVSYTIPIDLADLLDEYKYMEKIDKSKIVTKALLEYLPKKYLDKYIK